MPTPASIQRIYLVLLLGNTLAASFIWGINTIFLLDAGLSNLEAFAANAFFAVGMVVFEVPTGIVADTVGRRASYLLGTVTLTATTLLYVLLWELHAPFWEWAVVSMLLGLGFTFFSGAVEAWLVDALQATGFTGSLDSVFAKGQVVSGFAMLTGSVIGGYVAQVTSLGVPFLLRGAVLVVMFGLAFATDARYRLHAPAGRAAHHGNASDRQRLDRARLAGAGREVDHALVGLHRRRRLLRLLRAPAVPARARGAAGGVRNRRAGCRHRGRCADIVGGIAAPWVRRLFQRRTSALLAAEAAGTVTLGLIGAFEHFWVVLGLIVMWGLLSSAALPIRRAYLNGLIPSAQRATILSFDSMLGSSGGVAVQPALGRAADVWGYATSYVLGAAISAFALPFIALSRRRNEPADTVETITGPEAAEEPA